MNEPGRERVQALADISRSRYVAIATQPVHRLQIRAIVHNYGGIPYHSAKLHSRPCRHAAADRQTRVTTIHFSWSTTHAKCNKEQKNTVKWKNENKSSKYQRVSFWHHCKSTTAKNWNVLNNSTCTRHLYVQKQSNIALLIKKIIIIIIIIIVTDAIWILSVSLCNSD